MTTDAKVYDQRPSLGSGSSRQRLGNRFEESARIHGVLNIGLQLLRLIPRLSKVKKSKNSWDVEIGHGAV